MIKHFTKDNFSTEVLEASKTQPVLVDFFATWCGPCQAQGPIIEELAKDMEGKAVVGKIDTDQNLELARQYGIMSIPTIIIFRDGQPAERLVGVQQKLDLANMLTK